jgi:iron(III) transport system ATP-binding protein
MLKLEGLSKRFGSESVLTDVSLEISAGQIVGLIGPSGSGKTTLLRMIAGLLAPTSGSVSIDGQAVRDRRSAWFEADRDQPDAAIGVGFIFQSPGLFPHMTCRANCLAGMPIDDRIAADLQEYAIGLGMEETLDRIPSEVSRGQAQRVSTIRALLRQPTLLLLDEPTASLDWQSRERFVATLLSFHNRTEGLILLASHDLQLIEAVTGNVYEIRDGQIEQN